MTAWTTSGTASGTLTLLAARCAGCGDIYVHMYVGRAGSGRSFGGSTGGTSSSIGSRSRAASGSTACTGSAASGGNAFGSTQITG